MLYKGEQLHIIRIHSKITTKKVKERRKRRNKLTPIIFTCSVVVVHRSGSLIHLFSWVVLFFSDNFIYVWFPLFCFVVCDLNLCWFGGLVSCVGGKVWIFRILSWWVWNHFFWKMFFTYGIDGCFNCFFLEGKVEDVLCGYLNFIIVSFCNFWFCEKLEIIFFLSNWLMASFWILQFDPSLLNRRLNYGGVLLISYEAPICGSVD